jgi:uncharacterized protein YjbJ (UPF0337 family)
MKIGSVDTDQLTGLLDKMFGLGKELLGSVTGNERLQQEGEAQQAKGTEKLKALRLEAKAEAKEAKAEGFESKQRAAQKVKENA